MNTCYVVGCNVQNLYLMWCWMLLNVILYQPGKFLQRKISLVKQKLSSCSICCVNKIAMYFLHEFYGLFWAVMVILKNGLELLKFDGLYFFGIHINGRVWARKYSGLKNGPLQWPSLKKNATSAATSAAMSMSMSLIGNYVAPSMTISMMFTFVIDIGLGSG